MSTAIYAGSFDPVTNGHFNIMKRALRLFENLIVIIAVNPDKRYLFSAEDRKKMIVDALAVDGFKEGHYFDVVILENQYVVNWIEENVGYNVPPVLIRGIRGATDIEAERTLFRENSILQPKIETVFMMPPAELEHVSSSFVKALVGPLGWRKSVKRYVPTLVYKGLLKHFLEQRWNNLCMRNGITRGDALRKFEELYGLYTAAGRYYHTIEHIADSLEELDKVRADCQDPDAIEMAIWFHDAIYTASPESRDEELSAQMALNFLDKNPNRHGIDYESFAGRVYEMVLRTQHTAKFVDKPSDDCKIFLDIDLSVLGRKFDEYSTYSTSIWREYQPAIEKMFGVDARAVYVDGRLKVLRNLMDKAEKSNLFQTPMFRKRLEHEARRNLRHEILDLEAEVRGAP